MNTEFTSLIFIIITGSIIVDGQRSPYAGLRPLGYKDRFSPNTINSNSVAANEIGNRFGQKVTSQRIPYDAYGDAVLVNILNERPVEQRPYWLINYQAIEAHRHPFKHSVSSRFSLNSAPLVNKQIQRGTFAG